MNRFFYDSCFMFFQFLIPGFFLGLVYDVFRIIRIGRNDKTYRLSEAIEKRYFPQNKERKRKRPKNQSNRETVLIFIEDIYFFFIVAVTEILSIYYLNDGEIRIYCLLFSLIGFICYQKTFGYLVILLSKKILYLCRKILYFCICLILTPAFFIIKKLSRPAKVQNMTYDKEIEEK